MNFNDSTGCVLCFCTKCLGNQHVINATTITNFNYKNLSKVIHIETKFFWFFSEYKLVAFISHMGTSTMVGHYVCHIKKEGRWVIYNDEKVALSEHPPRDLAYLYLYQRQ